MTIAKLLEGRLTLNRVETAQVLGISPRTLDTYTLREDGPPFVKLQGKKMYPVKALQKWLEDHLQ